MEIYRPSEKVTTRGICLSVVVTGAMAAVLGFCYASVVGYFPTTNILVGVGAMILFGGLLGKGLEKVLNATGLRSPLVARVLAGFGIAVGIWSTWVTWLLWDLHQLIWRPDQIWRAVHEIALSVPNHAGLYLYQAFTTAVIAVMCFHNLRWAK